MSFIVTLRYALSISGLSNLANLTMTFPRFRSSSGDMDNVVVEPKINGSDCRAGRLQSSGLLAQVRAQRGHQKLPKYRVKKETFPGPIV